MIQKIRMRTFTPLTMAAEPRSSYYSQTMMLLSLFLLLIAGQVRGDESSLSPQTCSLAEHELTQLDPNLHEMVYDVGDGPQTTMVWVEPDISTFYNGNPPALEKLTPKYKGLGAKFINLSNKPVSLYWERREGGSRLEMRHHAAFGASGTGTVPGHRFLFTEDHLPDQEIKLFIVEKGQHIYCWDPYFVEGDVEQTEKNLSVLNEKEKEHYNLWRKTLSFHEQYKNFTGRSYMSNYLRKPPMHYMWPADYFGQEHWVTTRETHFVKLPPKEDGERKELPPKFTKELKSEFASRSRACCRNIVFQTSK
jgi:hypothetical protein